MKNDIPAGNYLYTARPFFILHSLFFIYFSPMDWM